MSKQFIEKQANKINDYLVHTWPHSTTQEAILWILNNLPMVSTQTPSLDDIELNIINKKIDTIPTGEQRVYRKALEGVLFYLGNERQWQLPEKIKQNITDTNHQYFEELTKGTAHAQQIFTRYQQHKTHFLTTRAPLTPCFVALMVGFEIAPLSLAHMCAILNVTDSITDEINNPRLAVTHFECGTDKPQVTHYHLSIICYRLLRDYYAQYPEQITVTKLYNHLTQWLEEEGLPGVKQGEWPRRFQISWYTRFKLPFTFIKDLAYPERHVGIPRDISPSTIKAKDIYAIDWDTKWFNSLKKSRTKIHWPHEILLKHSENPNAVEPPSWDAANILPRLLFNYTKQLIVFGGVKKANLALGSIKNYTSLKSKLELFPLPYADAINEETINKWAETVYDSIDSDIVKVTFYNFLRFLKHQEQTDTLDLSLFNSPLIPPSVSPARLSVDECDLLIKTLTGNESNHPLRSLFCIVAALLGFYAMLRRGEVLRLRCKDIQFEPSTALITITVTNTHEGNTKSDIPRKVYTILPKQYHRLFIQLLDIKENASDEQPWLGFEGEKYHSRQLYYLLPVSRALRFLFGTHLNFHHLRHSGVHLFMLQTLHCLDDTPDEQRGKTALEQEVLSSTSVATRFNYWFEGRKVDEVNDAIFLDEMGEQIGHIHYGTTRWSYLHDIEWLLPIISPAHSPYTRREYTHSELRYLLGLKPDSNDLSRILLKLSPEYANKTLEQKRSQPIMLSDCELREAVFGKAIKSKHAPLTVDHYLAWEKLIHNREHSLLSFIFKAMFDNKTLDLYAFSFIWGNGSKHHIKPISKKQRTALNNLPPILLSDDGQSLQISLACNSNNARAFSAMFKHDDWRWLNSKFVLCINRKVKPERQLALLKTQFAHENDTIKLKKIPKGETLLTIYLTPKVTLSADVIEYTQKFIHSLQSNEAQP
ncbi:site-specific integrase [Pseudoalteromonas nigrifaciens]|uniref:site-specific integrase n=1 Tax=Pseudoalteromonas nigrifaciens TaxID=28109 RepID=UPI0017889770|nr:site-specific integrase [Pseudoalteromonas nigrifaciens]MBE0421541.1 site-specific integrase [Pseudoalteromonas nigrifaciens]